MNRLIHRVRSNGWIELAARWILGLTFIYASYYKITSPGAFAKVVYGYDIFPHILINLIAIHVPFVELVTGLALISGIYVRSASIIINSMLIIFMLLISINLIRGHEFDCGCFSVNGSDLSKSPTVTLIRDVFYFLLGLQIIYFKGVRKGCLRLLQYNS